MRTARTHAAADTVHDDRSDLVVPPGHPAEPPPRVQDGLARPTAETLPGLHLVVEAAGRRALLAAGHVLEIVRLVALEPRPGAPAALLGSFTWRGVPVVAIDLAALLGLRRQPALDAQIAVLAGSPAAGLVLDRVHGLLERPARLTGAAPGAALLEGWEATGLVCGRCAVGGEVLPLLDPRPITALARGEGA
jgi:purine-binding chemotaxis protein CheW